MRNVLCRFKIRSYEKHFSHSRVFHKFRIAGVRLGWVGAKCCKFAADCEVKNSVNFLELAKLSGNFWKFVRLCYERQG